MNLRSIPTATHLMTATMLPGGFSIALKKPQRNEGNEISIGDFAPCAVLLINSCDWSPTLAATHEL